jgi:hypothetical protein
MLNVRAVTYHRRYPRHRVLKEGKIVSPDFCGSINVIIRDLSVGGARLEIPPFIEFPKQFDLFITLENLFYPAVMKWRVGQMAGIEFAGEPYRQKILNFNRPHNTM